MQVIPCLEKDLNMSFKPTFHLKKKHVAAVKSTTAMLYNGNTAQQLNVC